MTLRYHVQPHEDRKLSLNPGSFFLSPLINPTPKPTRIGPGPEVIKASYIIIFKAIAHTSDMLAPLEGFSIPSDKYCRVLEARTISSYLHIMIHNRSTWCFLCLSALLRSAPRVAEILEEEMVMSAVSGISLTARCYNVSVIALCRSIEIVHVSGRGQVVAGRRQRS